MSFKDELNQLQKKRAEDEELDRQRQQQRESEQDTRYRTKVLPQMVDQVDALARRAASNGHGYICFSADALTSIATDEYKKYNCLNDTLAGVRNRHPELQTTRVKLAVKAPSSNEHVLHAIVCWDGNIDVYVQRLHVEAETTRRVHEGLPML